MNPIYGLQQNWGAESCGALLNLPHLEKQNVLYNGTMKNFLYTVWDEISFAFSFFPEISDVGIIWLFLFRNLKSNQLLQKTQK